MFVATDLYKFLFFSVLLLTFSSFAQEVKINEEDISINKYVTGSLLVPFSEESLTLVILIQGSGPIDRNGNNPRMTNNSLKMLARGLAKNGIASFRYDKRISKMKDLEITEKELRFEDFITDAESVLDYFEDKDKFNKIIVLGHSQGSLVGMLAAKNKADAFISVAGVAQPIDSILIEQIGKQMPSLEKAVRNSLHELRKTDTITQVNPMLASILRPSVQPFLLSYIKYNPAEEIAELHIPVLIINGTRDLQVSIQEAKALKAAKPGAKLVLLKNMNHVLKKIEDPSANLASYNKPNKPLHPKLVPTIVAFVKG
ncbi:MAG TPA: alpha/beta fold hydrolase [Salinimicrobium sp.]|nr:alpha/beta fold hydrolase [Salinimicrobium sp.]